MFNTLIGRYGGVAGVGGAGVEASGGSEIITPTHKYHVFTSPGTLTLTNSGEVEYLVIAGGGAGGMGSPATRNGGGGGAGGIRHGILDSLTLGTYPITVGTGGVHKGGLGTAPPLSNGTDSTFSTITSNGGGASGNGASPPDDPYNDLDGTPGGSGGGGASEHHDHAGGGGAGNTPPTTPPQGNPGRSAGNMPGTNYRGGGGGSLSGTGIDGWGDPASPFPQFGSTILAPAIPGALQTAISTSGNFGGGGQAGAGVTAPSPLYPTYYQKAHNPDTPSGAGYGGVSPAPISEERGQSAVDGSGAGGGGSNSSQTAGDGGNGIVIIRYEL